MPVPVLLLLKFEAPPAELLADAPAPVPPVPELVDPVPVLVELTTGIRASVDDCPA